MEENNLKDTNLNIEKPVVDVMNDIGEVVAEIETQLDAKTQFAAVKYAIAYYSNLMGFLALLIIAIGMIVLISDLDFVVGITIVIAGIIVPFFVLILTYILTKRKIIRTLNENGTPGVQTIKFGDRIALSEQSKKLIANNIVDYSLFIKVVESEHYFVLFLNAMTVIIADKNGIKQGSTQILRQHLQARLNKKFILKVRKAV